MPLALHCFAATECLYLAMEISQMLYTTNLGSTQIITLQRLNEEFICLTFAERDFFEHDQKIIIKKNVHLTRDIQCSYICERLDVLQVLQSN